MQNNNTKASSEFNLFKYLKQNNPQKCLILDGGLGSELHRAYENNPEMEKNLKSSLWSAKILEKDPQQIKKIHENYINSGANIILSSSYQANLSVFQYNGYSHNQSIQLMQKSIEIIYEIHQNYKNTIFGISLGPYGAKDGKEYTGDYGEHVTKQDLIDFHKNRIEILLETPCLKNNFQIFQQKSFLCFETIPNLLEIEAICQILQEQDYKLSVAINIQCRNSNQLANKENIIQSVLPVILQQKKIQSIGINCCDPLIVEDLIDNIQNYLKQQKSDLLIMCYPNNGKKWDHENMQYVEGTELNSTQYAQLSLKWKQKGAFIIGGCCCTTPEYIQELSKYHNQN